MSMPDHIILSNSRVTGFTRIFCQKVSHGPGKLQIWIVLFYQIWRTRTHIENILPIWSRGSVAPGGGVMTLHDYGYLPPEVLKSYPVSE